MRLRLRDLLRHPKINVWHLNGTYTRDNTIDVLAAAICAKAHRLLREVVEDYLPVVAQAA